MKHFAVLLLLVSSVFTLAQSQTALPTADSDKNAKPADYSQEAYVVESQRTAYRFESEGTGTKEVTGRIRVQTEAGVEALGQLVFGYSAASEKLDIKYVRV